MTRTNRPTVSFGGETMRVMRVGGVGEGRWPSRRAVGSLALAVLGMLAAMRPAFAWKPTTHVYLAEVALGDALDDGKVTIFAVDYQNGKLRTDAAGRPFKIGDYAVNPAMLDAIRQYPAQFRAGVLGPDAYP